MREATPEFRDLALRLLMLEAGESQSPAALADGAERVCQKMNQQFARLIGPAGFRALTARGLALAKNQFPFLNGVEIGMPEGPCLTGLPEVLAGRDPTEAGADIAAIFASVIWLLSEFIGRDLTQRQLQAIWQAIWPGVSLGETGDGAEELKK